MKAMKQITVDCCKFFGPIFLAYLLGILAIILTA
jgi:hypothetical protein